jgi:chloramphenicol 3-O phosphotransferase
MSQITIIFLNGPSSSGKTTLAKELQYKLDGYYLHIGIDKMIGLMPSHLNNWEGKPAPMGYSWKASEENGHLIHEIQQGPLAKKISNSLKNFAVLLASEGYNLIIDEITLTVAEQAAWIKALSLIPVPFKILWVQLHPPLESLIKREQTRGNRMLGSAHHQFICCEKALSSGLHYDIALDTQAISTAKQIQIISQTLREQMPDSPTERPTHLYKIVSAEDWQKSQGKDHLSLPSFDDTFIHLATKDQLQRIVEKFWSQSQGFYILKVAYDKLVGRCTLEANPGGSTLYYHLYDGFIPLHAVEGSIYFESSQDFKTP